MNLQELVLGEKLEEESGSDSLGNIYQEKIAPITVVGKGREILSDNSEGIELHQNIIAFSLQLLSLARIHSNQRGFLTYVSAELIAKSSEYLSGKEGRKDLITLILHITNDLEVRLVYNSNEAMLDYLLCFWGEDAPEKLAYISSVKVPTVKRWIAGHLPSSYMYDLHNTVRCIHHLRHSLAYSDEEAKAWFEKDMEEKTILYNIMMNRTRKVNALLIEEGVLVAEHDIISYLR